MADKRRGDGKAGPKSGKRRSNFVRSIPPFTPDEDHKSVRIPIPARAVFSSPQSSTVPSIVIDRLRSTPSQGHDAHHNSSTPPTEESAHLHSWSPAGPEERQSALPESSVSIYEQGDPAPPPEYPPDGLNGMDSFAQLEDRDVSHQHGVPQMRSSSAAGRKRRRDDSVVAGPSNTRRNLRGRTPPSQAPPEQPTSTVVAGKRRADTDELDGRTSSPRTPSGLLPPPHDSPTVSHRNNLRQQQKTLLATIRFGTPEPGEAYKIELPDGSAHSLYYRFVEDSVVLEECIHATSDTIHWNVHISKDQWERKVTTAEPTVEQTGPGESYLPKGNLQFRLRSVLVDASGQEPFTPTQSDFNGRQTQWPASMAVSINENYNATLNRSGLAADVTDLLREGDNEIVVSAFYTEPCMYLLALETTFVGTWAEIKAIPTRIPATQVIRAITGELKNNSGRLEEDELIVSPATLTIDLIDPLTPEVWKTPVRGKECQHRECFDLEAFLSSRAHDFDEGGLTRPDRWTCPRCQGDARPNMLVIDEFLLDVRKSLEENNQLHADRILVKEGGSWEPRFGSSASRDQSTLPVRLGGNHVTEISLAPQAISTSSNPFEIQRQ